jgi:steroid delta-isomerase
MPDQHVMKAALQAYVDRTNAGDTDGLLALFTADAFMEDPVGTPYKYRAEMAELFRNGAAYGAHIEIVAPMRGSHGNEAAVMFDVCFTPPESPRLRIRSLDVCTFDEAGLITSLRGFWGPDDISEEPVTDSERG